MRKVILIILSMAAFAFSGVSVQEAKELTFKQLYGGVWGEYQNKPFFKNIVALTDDIWETYQYGKYYETENRTFYLDSEMTQSKLLNCIIQSKETTANDSHTKR